MGSVLEWTLALGTNLNRKLSDGIELVWKSTSYLDSLVGLAGSTEMMTSQAAEDRKILLEPFKTNLTNKTLLAGV